MSTKAPTTSISHSDAHRIYVRGADLVEEQNPIVQGELAHVPLGDGLVAHHAAGFWNGLVGLKLELVELLLGEDGLLERYTGVRVQSRGRETVVIGVFEEETGKVHLFLPTA